MSIQVREECHRYQTCTSKRLGGNNSVQTFTACMDNMIAVIKSLNKNVVPSNSHGLSS